MSSNSWCSPRFGDDMVEDIGHRAFCGQLLVKEKVSTGTETRKKGPLSRMVPNLKISRRHSLISCIPAYN